MSDHPEVDRFLNTVDEDADLRGKLAGALDNVQKIAKEHGFSFSEDDLRKGLRKRWGMNSSPEYHQDPDTCFFG